MGKFITEGPVGLNNFASFINENTKQFKGYSISKAFESAQAGGTYLPQGNFIEPHALSESYGAEAGFRFWINNNGSGTKHRTSALEGYFYSELKWFMETGFNGGSGTKHVMPFPYNNYLYNISKNNATNGTHGSGSSRYRILNGRLFHSDVSEPTPITSLLNTPSGISFNPSLNYNELLHPWVKYTVRTFFLNSFLGMPFPWESYSLFSPILKHIFNAHQGDYREVIKGTGSILTTIPIGGGQAPIVTGTGYRYAGNLSPGLLSTGFVSANNYVAAEAILYINGTWYGEFVRLPWAQQYRLLPFVYDRIHKLESWQFTSDMEDLYRQLWVDGPTPSSHDVGGNDFYPRTRSSVSDSLGRVSVENSKLKLVNPGESVTDTSNSMLIDDQLSEFSFGPWAGCYSQTFLKKLESNPCEVPIYLGAGDHGHGYLTLETDSTPRHYIQKNSSNDYKIMSESNHSISNGSGWEIDEISGSVEGWSQQGSATFDVFLGYLHIKNSQGGTSNDFFQNVHFVPGKKAILVFEYFSFSGGVALYIDDTLVFQENSFSDYVTKSLSFIPEQHFHKISLSLKSPSSESDQFYLRYISIIQEGDLISSHTSKADALDVWKKLHYQEHDYYHNNKYNEIEEVVSADVFTNGELGDFEYEESFCASKSMNFKYNAYITKLDGTSRALALSDISLNPSAPTTRWREENGDHINGEFYTDRDGFEVDKGFWSYSYIRDLDGYELNNINFDSNGDPSVDYFVIFSFGFNSYRQSRGMTDQLKDFYDILNLSSVSGEFNVRLYYSDSTNPDIDSYSGWTYVSGSRRGLNDNPNGYTYTSWVIDKTWIGQEFPDTSVEKRYYKIEYRAGSESVMEPEGTVIGRDMVSVICTKNDSTIRYNYSRPQPSFPVRTLTHKPDYRDVPVNREDNQLKFTGGKLVVFEGSTKLNLAGYTYLSSGNAYPETPGFNVTLDQSDEVNNRGVFLEELAPPSDPNWDNLSKQGKKIYNNSWLFIQNLRSRGSYSNSRPFNGYPNKAVTYGPTWYNLGDLRGPLTKDSLSALSLLRFEALRVGMLEAEFADNAYGSISGPIYNDLKYIPRNVHDSNSEAYISQGLKLRLHYLIDLEIEDKIQIERAAYFWEEIIKDDIQIDVTIMPSTSRKVGGTLASAGPYQYNVGLDSFFHNKNRAQVTEIVVFIDTDDIFGNPNSSVTPSARLPITNGWLEGANQLCSIMIHEIAHGLGVGTFWNLEVAGYYPTEYQWGFANVFGTQYNGAKALREYKSIVNSSTEIYVFDTATSSIQKKNISSAGVSFYTNYVPTQGGDSFEEDFKNWQEENISGGHPAEYAKKAKINGVIKTQPAIIELMTPTYDVKNSVLSKLTLGYLEDLGYTVDYSKAINVSQPLIGYTGTEYLIDQYYKINNPTISLEEYLAANVDRTEGQLNAPGKIKCNCKSHAIKNTVLPE